MNVPQVGCHRCGLPLLIAVLLTWTLLGCAEPMPAAVAETIQAPRKGFLAPHFALESTDGQTIRLSELQGRPIILNFWATWCAPCRAEMPALETVWQRFGRGEVMVIGVDQGESAATVLGFTEGVVGTTFPQLLDIHQDVGDSYQVTALPTTFFIDRSGRIREVRVGGPLDVATLLAALQAMETAPSD